MSRQGAYSSISLTDRELCELVRSKTQRAIFNQEMISLKQMGFAVEDIRWMVLNQGYAFDLLMRQANRFIKAHWVFEIDHQQLHRLRQQVEQSLIDRQTMLKFIRFGASKVMMYELFGLSVEKFKFWRCAYGMMSKGRAPNPCETKRNQIWQLWRESQGITVIDRLLHIYEITKVPLRSIWSEVQSWDKSVSVSQDDSTQLKRLR